MDRRFESLFPATRATHFGYIVLTHSHMRGFLDLFFGQATSEGSRRLEILNWFALATDLNPQF